MNRPSSFNDFNQALIEDFRANRGQVSSGPFVGRPILLLTTTGAKSGGERTMPLAYTRDRDSYIVIASKGGAPTNPGWFHNLIAHPVVTVEVGPEKFQARASVVEDAQRRRLYDAHAEVLPVFADYEKKTSRRIPVIRLERIDSSRN
jgi:deazaflavin-dependent oxidoreductase (nitroreductase family)